MPNPQGMSLSKRKVPATAGTLSLAVLFVFAAGSAVPSAGESRVVVHGPNRVVLPEDSFPGTVPSFEQRTVTERGALEPPLVFDADGSLFYPSWANNEYSDYLPPGTTTILYRSTTKGESWADVTPQIAGLPFANKGGDPILYRDEETGRLFYLLYFQGCTHLAWTDDGGSTWDRPIHGRICEPGGVTDYPKLWTSRPVDGPATPAGAPFYLHLCYNALYRLACQRSIDGGRTFAPSPSPDPESLGKYLTETCWSFHASWVVTGPDGTIYMPRPYCNNLEVAVSRDNGLTWERTVVAEYEDAFGTDFGSDVRLARDASGTLYYLWIAHSWYIGDGERPLLSISRDDGETWSAPIDVGVPGLTAAKLPSIVAGDEGRIAFFYVGSTVPGGFDAAPEDMATAHWDGYAGFSLNATDAAPVFATNTVNPADDPLRIGPCEGRCIADPDDCALGCEIGSPRVGMFDYLELALDPTSGMVAVSVVDLCGPACVAQGSAEAWSFTGAVGVQIAGASLLH